MADIQIDDLSIHDKNEKAIFDNIHEYEDNNIKEEGQKSKSYILRLIIVVGGLIIISLLLNISDRLKSFYPPLGYTSLAIFFVLFIWFYVRPIWLLFKMDYFEINRTKDAKLIKKHNADVRRNVAKKIIDFQYNVKNAGWYDQEYVEKLRIALINNDNNMIHKYLTILMNDSIKKSSDKIIVNSAVQSGIYAAVSQSPQLDALLVFSVNLKMIKDLIFLYGFRPTETKLIKIAFRVIFSSIAAYKIDGAQIGAFITGKFTAKSIPLVANGTAFLADAVIQAITNGTLTMWIGYKTLNYMMKEYKLQTLYEEIDILDDSDEFGHTRRQIIDQITNKVPFIKTQLDKMTDDNTKSNDIGKSLGTNGIKLPKNSNGFNGRPFIEVQKELLKLGFSIEKISLKSVVKEHAGFFSRDGEVLDVLFDGKNDIEKDTILGKDTDIEIKYLLK